MSDTPKTPHADKVRAAATRAEQALQRTDKHLMELEDALIQQEDREARRAARAGSTRAASLAERVAPNGGGPQ